MGRYRVRMVLAGAAVVVCAAPLAVIGAARAGAAPARVAVAQAGGWGKAIEVRGTAALDKVDGAQISAMSCAAPGSCVAGGDFGATTVQPVFLVTEVRGRWGRAIAVPGMAALNNGNAAFISSVSCAAAGSCAAGGYYAYNQRCEMCNYTGRAFVVTEAKGRWRRAIEVPGTAPLNQGFDAAVTAVSCGAAGSCAAVGFYTDRSGVGHAFVVTEVRDRWGRAIAVPDAYLSSVSCAAAGSCTTGGSYAKSGNGQAFVMTEAKGRWGKPVVVPGIAALNKDGTASVSSVSCTAAGSCAAGGYYDYGSRREEAFVATKAKGRWGKAIEVPGYAALNKSLGFGNGVNSVSCAAAGSCAAGGTYSDRRGHVQAFVVTEVRGRWGKAIQVPGIAALRKGGGAGVTSVSCSARSCAAGGDYSTSFPLSQAFVVTEAKGRWGKAIQVPGLAALNKHGIAELNSLSCAPAGSCAAGGSYYGSVQYQAFVVSKS